MGKALGAIGSVVTMGRSIGKGVGKAQKGYDAATSTLSAGKKEALGYISPYMDIGQEAISPLSQLLLGKSYDPKTGEFSDVLPEDRMSAFTTSPDYQFRLQEGQKALEASQAARGGLLSGRALKEAQTFGQGQASSEYGNYLQRLMGLIRVGQASAGQGANIAGNVAGQIGQAQIGRGNISMQGTIAKGQQWADVATTAGSELEDIRSELAAAASKAASGAASGAAAGGAGASAFSDIKLKKHIKRVKYSDSGIPIYHFEYKDKKYGDGQYEGVMAQDLLILKPEAVSKEGDYLKVDYDQLDVDFRRL